LEHEGPVLEVLFHPAGKGFATRTAEFSYLWDANGKALGVPWWHVGGVTFMAFSPDGRSLLTGEKDHVLHWWHAAVLRQWDTATGQALGEAITLGGPLLDVSFSPDGRTFVTRSDIDGAGGRPQEMRLWETATGRGLGRIGQNSDTGVAWHPSGSKLLVC